MAEIKDLNKLISLTFDENPAVRIKAAEILGRYDDPAAVFALMELNYDKDPNVRKKAQEIISSKKESGGAELLSFAELFSKGATETEKSNEMTDDKKEKLLSPISKMFEKHLGKEKAEIVKKKMMPTIEKIYHRSTSTKKTEQPEEQGRKVIQEFLTSYLEALSGINEEKTAEAAVQRQEIIEEKEEVKIAESEKPPQEVELEEVGKEIASEKLESDLQRIENDEIIEMEEEKEIEKLPNTFFKKAYEVMMLSGGDQEIMEKEMERMLKNAEKDIMLAFKLARRKFKEKKITNITKIKDGMRNINTDPLLVKSVENIEYEKNKKKKEKSIATRIVVNDEDGNEGVIFLYDGRGTIVKPGMRIKVIRGQAKLFESSGETVITIGKKGEVYIIL